MTSHGKQAHLPKTPGKPPNNDAGRPSGKELNWKLDTKITRFPMRPINRANRNIRRKWLSIEMSWAQPLRPIRPRSDVRVESEVSGVAG
jgi:hypothetical protein